jgi:hypothetical protein
MWAYIDYRPACGGKSGKCPLPLVCVPNPSARCAGPFPEKCGGICERPHPWPVAPVEPDDGPMPGDVGIGLMRSTMNEKPTRGAK